MAEFIKQEYDLTVLKVSLLETSPNVLFTLQTKVEQKLSDVMEWRSDTSDILPSRSERHSHKDANLPGDMLNALQGWYGRNVTDGAPLWVHLVKPYGALRLVPWERSLGGAIGIPILMLPDFIFPPPRTTSEMLDVALCGSAPLNYEEHWVYHAMIQAIVGILTSSLMNVRLHVFADATVAPRLRAEISARVPNGGNVQVYDTTAAARFAEADPSSRMLDSTGQLRSPWLLWMRDALRGTSIDLVHFVCHGYLARDRGGMLFAQSPVERTDRYLAGPVGLPELTTFLTQVGAWSTVFTSLPDDNAEPGLRALADELAQNRPGPMMMHVLNADPAAAVLGQAYELLFGTEPATVPHSTSLFIYCQPYRVHGIRHVQRRDWKLVEASLDPSLSRNPAQSETIMRAEGESALDPFFANAEHVLPWVASTERFAEQVQLRWQQLARDEVGSSDQKRLKLVMATVDTLREAVARQASSAGTPREGGGRGEPEGAA